jgi:hypothetical protein
MALGHVKAIQAQLAEIDATASSVSPFAAWLRGFVHQFDLRPYMAALEEIDRYDP